jgi:hypothetical protein
MILMLLVGMLLLLVIVLNGTRTPVLNISVLHVHIGSVSVTAPHRMLDGISPGGTNQTGLVIVIVLHVGMPLTSDRSHHVLSVALLHVMSLGLGLSVGMVVIRMAIMILGCHVVVSTHWMVMGIVVGRMMDHTRCTRVKGCYRRSCRRRRRRAL